MIWGGFPIFLVQHPCVLVGKTGWKRPRLGSWNQKRKTSSFILDGKTAATTNPPRFRWVLKCLQEKLRFFWCVLTWNISEAQIQISWCTIESDVSPCCIDWKRSTIEGSTSELKDQLVGGFNPFEKYARQIMSNWIISPGIGVKIPKIFETTCQTLRISDVSFVWCPVWEWKKTPAEWSWQDSIAPQNPSYPKGLLNRKTKIKLLPKSLNGWFGGFSHIFGSTPIYPRCFFANHPLSWCFGVTLWNSPKTIPQFFQVTFENLPRLKIWDFGVPDFKVVFMVSGIQSIGYQHVLLGILYFKYNLHFLPILAIILLLFCNIQNVVFVKGFLFGVAENPKV